jgi:anti-sigma factor RsiW
MSAYLDEQLTAVGRRRMERHLAECRHCGRLIAELRRVIGGLRHLPSPEGTDVVQMARSVRARLTAPPEA